MKKILSSGLVLLLVVFSFFGCSKDVKDDTQNTIKYVSTIDSTYSTMNDSVKRAYDTICQSVINLEDEARINVGLLDDVNTMFYTSFPLRAIVASLDIKTDNSGVVINYVMPKDELKKDIQTFFDSVDEIESICDFKGSSDNVYFVNLYKYFVENIKESKYSEISIIDSLIQKNGTSFSYSALFEYFLERKGINAYHIIASDKDGVAYALSMAEINGELYYFDAYGEGINDKQCTLHRFAMSTSDVSKLGISNMKFTNQEDCLELNFESFKKCRKSSSWKLVNSSLKITNEGNKESSILLK